MTRALPAASRHTRGGALAVLFVAALALTPASASAQATQAPAAPQMSAAPAATQAIASPMGGALRLEVDLGQQKKGWGTAIRIFLMLTLISLAPAILLSVTSFTRIVIVLGFLRQATGVQQLPPNQVLIGLALFLSIFTMAPVWQQVKANALDPYEAGQLDESTAIEAASAPLRTFMLGATSDSDLALFLKATQSSQPQTRAELPMHIVVPAYMLSELKTAFQMGALLFFPFLVVDLIVASVLMSMGMMMVPPVMVSLPIKVILFVLVDGWHLVVESLLHSLGVG